MKTNPEKIKIAYNLNSLNSVLMEGGKILSFLEHESHDLYIIIQYKGSLDVDIFKTMNKSFNSPDFSWCCERDSILEAFLWIDDDMDFAQQISMEKCDGNETL
jgi:hypothetical protein